MQDRREYTHYTYGSIDSGNLLFNEGIRDYNPGKKCYGGGIHIQRTLGVQRKE